MSVSLDENFVEVNAGPLELSEKKGEYEGHSIQYEM
jgi:hypothetical protein